MDDDLGVSAALAVLHNAVGQGNVLLGRSQHREELASVLQSVRAMAAVLGFDPLDAHWRAPSDVYQPLAAALIEDLLLRRQEARANRDFQAADSIRARLVALGVDIEDTAAGTRWSMNREM
jgi:cysteinyl-tRNA synthetase